MNNNDCDRCGREAELYYDEESSASCALSAALLFDVLIESLEAARKRTIEVSRGMKELEETLTAMREASDMLADLYRIGERD